MSLKDLKKSRGDNMSFRELDLNLPKSLKISRLVVNKTGKLLLLVSSNHVAVVHLTELVWKKGIQQKIQCRFEFFILFVIFIFIIFFLFRNCTKLSWS